MFVRIRRLGAVSVSAALLALLAGGRAAAQEATPSEGAEPAAAPPESAPAGPLRSGNGPWSVGFQSSWPTWGVSGSFDVNEQITAQAIVGAFGTLTSFGGRALYRFSAEPSYSLYGYGTVGMWRYGGILRENVVGVGGGGGVELDWRRLLSPDDGSFPPLFSTIDLGLVVANFEHYNFNSFSIGTGLHYRF